MPKTITKGTWTKVAFGDVVQLSKERSKDPEADGLQRYIGLEHIEPGDLRIRSWGHISDGTTFTSVFRPRQVLFGKRRAYQRKIAVADFSGVCSGDIYVLEPSSERLLPELLPFLCQTEEFFEHAVGTSAGSLSPRTNWKQLSKYEFALPPLEEQRRIVKVLGAVDEASDSLLSLAAALDNVSSAVSHGVFGDAKTVRLESLVTRVTKGTTPTTLGFEYVDSGVPFVRAEDVCDRGVDMSACSKRIPGAVHAELSRSQLAPNDVLLTIAGTVGRVGFVPSDAEEANCNQAVAIIRARSVRVARFLFSWLQTSPARAQMFGGQVTGTISNLSLRTIRGLQVPLVSEARQDEIVGISANLSDSRHGVKHRVHAVRSLRQNILSHATQQGGI